MPAHKYVCIEERLEYRRIHNGEILQKLEREEMNFLLHERRFITVNFFK